MAVSCALTHDFGITRVPEQILNKVSPLDEQEMKSRPGTSDLQFLSPYLLSAVCFH